MTNTDTTAALVRLDHEGHHALLAPASAQGRFVVVLSSSVTGEIARRPVRGRMPAFAEAVRMLRERAAAEASHSVAAMHGEIISVRSRLILDSPQNGVGEPRPAAFRCRPLPGYGSRAWAPVRARHGEVVDDQQVANPEHSIQRCGLRRVDVSHSRSAYLHSLAAVPDP